MRDVILTLEIDLSFIKHSKIIDTKLSLKKSFTTKKNLSLKIPLS